MNKRKTAESSHDRLASRFFVLQGRRSMLSPLTALDQDEVRAHYEEGEKLAAQMEDQQRGAFFQDVKRKVE